MSIIESLEWLMKQEDYVPENAEDGEHYQWKDFLDFAKGNIMYAVYLRQRVERQHPMTLVYEDLQEGDIVEVKDQYVMTYGEELTITEE